MSADNPNGREIETLYKRLDSEAEASGYHLNPDAEFTASLVQGLLINENRYGYRACPCRLADGEKSADLDIVCPCDYRDADLDEFGACYCKLYVSKDVLQGKKPVNSVPERRPPEEERAAPQQDELLPAPTAAQAASSMPVWRCRVCGYLCARETPPAVCPICKAAKERFERFEFFGSP